MLTGAVQAPAIAEGVMSAARSSGSESVSESIRFGGTATPSRDLAF